MHAVRVLGAAAGARSFATDRSRASERARDHAAIAGVGTQLCARRLFLACWPITRATWV
jgi:hypothetical protein